MMAMMMISRNPEKPTNHSISDQQPITPSTYPITWKLYENPFYYPNQPIPHHQQVQQQQQNHKQLHHLNLPISTRKISASFWDLTFIRPVMESELETAKAQITELKAEVEYERKARKKMESVNKKLNRELSEERKGREALERVCGELAREISAAKAEINRMRKEMEEERKMLRMAEVFREERVQMKLAEAKILLEDKISELEETKQMRTEPSNQVLVNNVKPVSATTNAADIFSVKLVRCGSGEKSTFSVDNGGSGIANSLPIQRRRSPEAENPHIKRGIKGFVEFPKVVRAIGSRSRHLGSKMECQRAQLRILLKQKNPTRSNGLIMS